MTLTNPLLSVRDLTVSVRDRGVMKPLVSGLSFDLSWRNTGYCRGERVREINHLAGVDGVATEQCDGDVWADAAWRY